MNSVVHFYILLRRGDGGVVGTCKVSMEDAARLARWRWGPLSNREKTHVYARRIEGKRSILMHREIARTPSGMQTDHINRDTLDNRRENLRSATSTENQLNRPAKRDSLSGAKGVNFWAAKGMWRARITVPAGAVDDEWKARRPGCGRRVELGLFNTKEEAIAAYNAACVKAHGQFARPNS